MDKSKPSGQFLIVHSWFLKIKYNLQKQKKFYNESKRKKKEVRACVFVCVCAYACIKAFSTLSQILNV